MKAGEELKTEKSRLREELKRLVKELPEEYRGRADQAIAERLFLMEAWRQAKAVFCYVGTGGEIDTWPIIARGLSEGKRMGIPFCTGPGIMEARQITGRDSLVPGRFGIQEPRQECPYMAPEEFDLVIVPGLSFTMEGGRLGYGGGYYDRYLPLTAGLKLALCRETCLRLQLPAESHDVPMDVIITENSTKVSNPSEKV